MGGHLASVAVTKVGTVTDNQSIISKYGGNEPSVNDISRTSLIVLHTRYIYPGRDVQRCVLEQSELVEQKQLSNKAHRFTNGSTSILVSSCSNRRPKLFWKIRFGSNLLIAAANIYILSG